jgi:hypothetical protein
VAAYAIELLLGGHAAFRDRHEIYGKPAGALVHEKRLTSCVERNLTSEPVGFTSFLDGKIGN